jgi:hypothetical protein
MFIHGRLLPRRLKDKGKAPLCQYIFQKNNPLPGDDYIIMEEMKANHRKEAGRRIR